jgi:hypothetical protein
LALCLSLAAAARAQHGPVALGAAPASAAAMAPAAAAASLVPTGPVVTSEPAPDAPRALAPVVIVVGALEAHELEAILSLQARAPGMILLLDEPLSGVSGEAERILLAGAMHPRLTELVKLAAPAELVESRSQRRGRAFPRPDESAIARKARARPFVPRPRVPGRPRGF